MNKNEIINFLIWLVDCYGMDNYKEAERVASEYINKDKNKELIIT